MRKTSVSQVPPKCSTNAVAPPGTQQAYTDHTMPNMSSAMAALSMRSRCSSAMPAYPATKTKMSRVFIIKKICCEKITYHNIFFILYQCYGIRRSTVRRSSTSRIRHTRAHTAKGMYSSDLRLYSLILSLVRSSLSISSYTSLSFELLVAR